MPQGARKLWQSDYRPGRPARQPGLRTSKRFPILRTLLLAGIAGFLYARFDTLWSRAQSRLRPEVSTPETGIAARPWVFNRDSSSASLRCGPEIHDCARAAGEVEPGLESEIGWLLEKAVWRHELKRPQATGISLSFRDSGGSRLPALTALKGEESGGTFRYRRESHGQNFWCDEKRGCLDQPVPTAPMQGAFRNTDAWVSMTSEHPEIHPTLAGRILTVDSLAPGDLGITLYHGRERYTHYRGLKRLAPGLAAGKIVKPSGILGFASPIDSSGFSARFRAEESGMPKELFAGVDGREHGD